MPSKKPDIRRILLGCFLTGLLLYFCWLMLRITAQYIPIRDDVAFLRIKQQYLPIIEWKVAFFVHVYSSMFALIAGFTQFWPTLLRRWPCVHRWMGRLYVYNILLITGPSSLIMALHANGGWSSRLAFATLGVLWVGTTALGLRAIVKRRVTQHRAWLIRSYALTLSAITLRFWKFGIVLLFQPPPMDVYRIVAWLGWIPNLLLAEWIIYKLRHPKKSAKPLPSAELASLQEVKSI